MDETDALKVLTHQVDAMNFQLYHAEQNILDLRRLHLSITKLIFVITLIMLLEALTISCLTFKIYIGGQ